MAIWELFRGGTARLTDGLWSSFFGLDNFSGKTVTTDTALRLATVFACVRLTAQAVSVMPLQLFQEDSQGVRGPIKDLDLLTLLKESPNADQTPVEFWEGLVAWMLVDGNAYAEKQFSGGKLIGLAPLASSCVTPRREDDGELVYRVNDRGQTDDLPREKVFHLKGFGFGGDMGLSIVAYGAQTFGAAIATDESAAKMFANGLQTSGMLKSDQVLKPEQREQLRRMMQAYAGSTNAGKLMILEAGLEYQQLSLNPEDAQMLETRRFAIEEICRWFGIPPIIVGHSAQGQTMWGSGVEQILIAWLTLGLNPILRRIEQRLRKSVIAPHFGGQVYAEFNREGLLQADSAAKAAFLSTMTQNGLMTRNEGRTKLNLPRVEGGDALTAQSNLLPIDRLGAVPNEPPAVQSEG